MAGDSPPTKPVSAACQAQLDAFCNSEKLNGAGCLDPTRKAFGNASLPLVGLFSATATDASAAWRCFSHLGVVAGPQGPRWNTSLPPPSGYPGYCTTPALADIYRNCGGSGGGHRSGEAAYYGFRIPGVVYDAKHDVLMTFAQGMYTTCGASPQPLAVVTMVICRPPLTSTVSQGSWSSGSGSRAPPRRRSATSCSSAPRTAAGASSRCR